MDMFVTWLESNHIFNPPTLLHYWDGFVTTVQLVFLALVIGLVLALPLAILRDSKNPLISKPIWLYVYVFRGTPLLIQLYIIYYGVTLIDGIQETIWWVLLEDPFIPALIAFVLNTTAYTTEIIRGAIAATPKGEIEAAKAYGMSWWQSTRRIILPSAMRRALPAYSNEVIFMLHASAIASVVTIVDLTGAARLVNSRYYAPFESFLTAGLFYMALTFMILACFKFAEKRFLAYLRPLS